VLAREPGHPLGDDEVAYTFVAPVDAEGRIDQKLWRAHREACRVARQRPNEDDQLGHLVHHAGTWHFHYDDETRLPDDVGFHFADERFVVGEYVSINERGKMHTYRVTTETHL
jgi:hypothetical protein